MYKKLQEIKEQEEKNPIKEEEEKDLGSYTPPRPRNTFVKYPTKDFISQNRHKLPTWSIYPFTY